MEATRSKRSVKLLFNSDFRYQFPVIAFLAEPGAAERNATHSTAAAMATQISETTLTLLKEKQANVPRFKIN